MPGRPTGPHPLPPLRRDYEGSRLDAQHTVSAYERLIPIIRRIVKTSHDSPNPSEHRTLPPGMRRVIGGTHQ